MGRKTFAAETVAEAYLALLRDRGVDRLFVNAGTDFASIVEAYARAKDTGLEFPEVVVCPHENLAVSMAHGAYLANGRPQAVMLHNERRHRERNVRHRERRTRPHPGAADGRAHTAVRTHGVRVPQRADPLGPGDVRPGGDAPRVREVDYELRDGVQLEEVVDRAVTQGDVGTARADLPVAPPRGPRPRRRGLLRARHRSGAADRAAPRPRGDRGAGRAVGRGAPAGDRHRGDRC